jgi:hypothetical protein
MDDHGFKIVGEQLVRKPSTISRKQLAPKFRSFTDNDLTTSDAFIQAVKI